MTRSLAAALAALPLAPGLLHAQAPAGAAPPAEVMVLSTLHRLHERVPGYGYEELRRVVEELAPDVLAERTPEAARAGALSGWEPS